ncbi:uncharacterized protein LOC132280812 [Cornus florida]|uniref:uncharacterized protein LOC132280812 n=1 Tax=Cornus florida TaxID=4283 RepID=UPI0028A1C194|nr:uncharacterized protein LOC132280812 [Cornus florida]
MGTFQEFYCHGTFEKSLNASFITLIPKKGGASDIKDIWPISLIGCLYKLIAKVLISRMSNVLDGLISESQNAFVGGRQILDFVLIVGECVNSRLRNGFFVFCVSLILRKLMIMLIRSLFYIYFGGWGLVIDLSKLMRKAEDLGYTRGFRVGRDVEHQIYLRCTLAYFQAVSGRKIIVGKSVLVPVGDVPDISSLAAVLGCGVGSFPLPYLGLPLGVSSTLVGN